ncbi:hypothetical protein Trydic_g1462 [Trypoxylus dichotomus]
MIASNLITKNKSPSMLFITSRPRTVFARGRFWTPTFIRTAVYAEYICGNHDRPGRGTNESLRRDFGGHVTEEQSTASGRVYVSRYRPPISEKPPASNGDIDQR